MQEFHRSEIEKFFDKEININIDEIKYTITKKKFHDYVNEIHEIFNDKNIKKMLKNKNYETNKKLLDFIILFTFHIYKLFGNTPNAEKLGVYTTYFCFSYFRKYYKYVDEDYKYVVMLYYKKKIQNFSVYYLVKNIGKEFIFPDTFYDTFLKDEKEMEIKDFLKENEICGICLIEYDNDMISYCGIHFICLECYKETDVEKCINKCETKELVLYKKT